MGVCSRIRCARGCQPECVLNRRQNRSLACLQALLPSPLYRLSPLRFLLHCPVTASALPAQLGTAEYSYRFVLEGFRSVLERLGEVIEIDDPARKKECFVSKAETLPIADAAATRVLCTGVPRLSTKCPRLPADERLMAFCSHERPFLLCVGTLEVRKNGIALLKAWQRLRASLGDATPHLVFSGRRGWKIDPFFSLLNSDPWLRSQVSLIADASDADIAFLHERSLCSIYPSLYEGWGLPVGEAAWFGRTCITSRESSLPEVCGRLPDRSAAPIAKALTTLPGLVGGEPHGFAGCAWERTKKVDDWPVIKAAVPPQKKFGKMHPSAPASRSRIPPKPC